MLRMSRAIGLAPVLLAIGACAGGGSGSGDSGAQPPPPSTPTYSVATSAAGSGSGSISPTSRNVSQGSLTSFTISPTSGSLIASVVGCGGSLSGNTYTTGPINNSCTVSVTFNLRTYTVTATAGSGGSISPSSIDVSHGGTTTFTVTPDSGRIIEAVSGCGGSLNGSIYTTAPITAACSVSVGFNSTVAVLNRSELYVVDDRGVLGVVDPDTGSVKTIGRTGVGMTDIAFHPGGDLYGISFSSLYKVNKNTGSAKLIGAHRVPGGNSLTFSDNGILLAAGNLSTDLFKLNHLEGASENLGNTGYYAAGDLAFQGDNLFLSASNGDLVSVDSQGFVGTAPVGSLGRSDVFGLALSDNGRFYGVGSTDIFEINSETGAPFNVMTFRGQGLNTAYGMAASKPPLFPIADHSEDVRDKVSTCFGAYGPDDGTRLTYVGEGLLHPALDLAFEVGTSVQAPTSGTLVFYRRPATGDLMQTFFVLAGDDGRSYIFAHVVCSDSVCDTSQPAEAITDAYPAESRKKIARGQILGSVGDLVAPHLHFGVVTGSMINADGTLRQEFRDGDVTWATINYGSATVATADDARRLARTRGFVDPMSLYVRPTGCEVLHTGVVGLTSSTVTVRVESSGDLSDGPYEAFVEPAVEFELGPGATGRTVRVAIDVADGSVVFDYSQAGTGSFATSSFNGYILKLDTDGLTWESVAIDPDTTLQLSPDRVSFDEKNIRINVSGLSYSSSSRIVLRVDAERQ